MRPLYHRIRRFRQSDLWKDSIRRPAPPKLLMGKSFRADQPFYDLRLLALESVQMTKAILKISKFRL
jgi:hypothetical protein